MKRIFYFCIVVFLFGVIIGYLFLGKLASQDEVGKETKDTPQEWLKNDVNTDGESVVSVEAQEIKISPQAVLIINKHFKGCNHTITNVISVPTEMVNLTEEKLIEAYPDWEVIDFSNRQVSIYKEFDGVCNEHYRVKESNGFVTVYYLDEGENEKLYDVTDISVEYLTEGDREKIKKGVNVYGKNELNALLENFE
ncbi:MAG: BofC C-terminal domain-containing protein [Clostridia bacterium]|nr:BofC C-terminal domain-containing protein [Clostridia bacterium]